MVGCNHRVDRVRGFFPSRPNWDPPQASVFPPLVPGGPTYVLAGEGVGGPNSYEGTDAGTCTLFVQL
jgi:hypothetical protein